MSDQNADRTNWQTSSRGQGGHDRCRHDEGTNLCCSGVPVNVNVIVNIPSVDPTVPSGGGKGCLPGSGQGGGSGGGGGGGGGKGAGDGSPGGKGRPTHQTGTSDGTIKNGAGGKGGITSVPGRPKTQWPGTRTQLYLPFLAIRAWAGDTAKRPIQGPFWESPDVLITPNVAPANAPVTPPAYGATAQAGVDNTLYAHVWNLGQAPCYGALVQFYWCNPRIGFNAEKGPNFVGQTFIDLGPRHGTGSHKLVKCPVSWVAHYENGGHECLIVRISQPVTDPLSWPPWDASQNRHIGQRNIHVMTAEEAAAQPTIPIEIGPMFGQTGTVAVARAETKTMPWLHLVTMKRDPKEIPATGAADGFVGLTAPTSTGRQIAALNNNPDPQGTGQVKESHAIEAADDLQVGFIATDANPGNGKANVYRVSGTQNGQLFGGYTVVVMGS